MLAILKQSVIYRKDSICLTHFGGAQGVFVDWGSLLNTGSQAFCLNLGGDLMVLGGRSRLHLLAQMIGTFRVTDGLKARTMLTSESAFDFLVLEVGLDWIEAEFGTGLGSLPKERAVIWSKERAEVALPARIIDRDEKMFYSQILSPPVGGIAKEYWLHAKIMEFLSIQIFREDVTFFCKRQKAQTRERVAKVLGNLKERMEEPLNLAALAEEIGVTPTTLSRLVSLETGITLSRHLRAMRIERALELIRNEGKNVTTAAVEVGYSSLSHFTKAFVEETGQRPSDFL